jgi:hypothetical protein
MFRQFAATATVALLLCTAVSASAVQPCEQYMSCQTCIAAKLCGWCSDNVVYPGNQTGGQCAGFTPGHATPFKCNAVFSTETCEAGYKCDESNFQCKITAPGKGKTRTECESTCIDHGQVFLCNHTEKKCNPAKKGTPHATSMSTCQAACVHPSHHPSSHHPSSPQPHHLYACNHTSGQCTVAPAGKGSAQSVCEQECKKINPKDSYACNHALKKCEKMPAGVPGGESLAKCEKACEPQPKPGPPPSLLDMTFRGVKINNGYQKGEFDLQVNNTIVTFVAVLTNEKVTGTPSHIPMSKLNEMWITFTSGPASGKMVKTISAFGDAGPNTKFLTMAMSAAGGATPATIKAAMATKGPFAGVYAFAACQTPVCDFKIGMGVGASSDFGLENFDLGSFIGAQQVAKPLHDASADRCSQYSSSCSVCLSHEFCGWCSVNVTNKDGTQGLQCAGFNKNNHTAGTGWKCNGKYSTFACDAGFKCDHKSLQCVPAAAGNGLPKAQCEQTCKPTPPPTPKPKMALCNETTKKCLPCPHNETTCPGALPMGACEAACSKKKKGPHAKLIGIWRGIYIQDGFKRETVTMVVNKTSMSLWVAGKYQFSADVTSMGSDAMLLKINDGQFKGWKYGAEYQIAGTTGEAGYEMITLANGKYGQGFPPNYSAPMSTKGMTELVLAKCEAAPCKFDKPQK